MNASYMVTKARCTFRVRGVPALGGNIGRHRPIKEDKQGSLSLLNGGYYLIRNVVTQSVLTGAFVNIKH